LKNGSPIPGATAQTLILSPAEVAAAAASGTARSYPLRVLIHVDAAGTARLLSQVFIGQLAAGASGLCVRESDLKADARHLATRLLAAHMPLDVDLMAQVDPARGSGTVELGQTLERLVPLPFDANTNPFVHTYHPDHDNKTARMSPYGVAGAESYDVSRVCRFTFPAARPTSNANSAWGTSYLSGTYSETITGLHKDPLTVTGTFELRRVNTISAITLPSAAGQ
jgi:hypothetical protein